MFLQLSKTVWLLGSGSMEMPLQLSVSDQTLTITIIKASMLFRQNPLSVYVGLTEVAAEEGQALSQPHQHEHWSAICFLVTTISIFFVRVRNYHQPESFPLVP